MAILGSILGKVLELRKSLPVVRIPRSNYQLQRSSFIRLLKKARYTQFGQHYGFDEILNSNNPMRAYQQRIPVFDYSKISREWWNKSLNNEQDVCWPGVIKYFALSSGTSEAASKYIPVSNEMLRSIKRTSVRQIMTLSHYDIPDNLLEKGFLAIGGSTNLKSRGSYLEGDLSGITARNIPFWFQEFYKPGKEIAHERDWNTKIEKIVASAKDWDIGFLVGVPAWIQLVMERVIEHYKLKNIHEIWPSLTVLVHGGVAFGPYRDSIQRLCGKPLICIETYLASEGFIAYQTRPGNHAMQLVLNNGLFFEFIPFNEDNFFPDGSLKENPKALLIDEVQEGKEYAIILSTNAGAWRYLIGDTIRFTSKAKAEIVITGRTKHFISLCGEHVSVDNMNQVVAHAAEHLSVCIQEFMVAGVPYDNLFAHHWYIGSDKAVDAEEVRNLLDERMKQINDDYKTERISALKEVIVEVLPIEVFHAWMDHKGKMGGQHKFPRVMKSNQLSEWQDFVFNTPKAWHSKSSALIKNN
jgi:hypothetical protein